MSGNGERRATRIAQAAVTLAVFAVVVGAVLASGLDQRSIHQRIASELAAPDTDRLPANDDDAASVVALIPEAAGQRSTGDVRPPTASDRQTELLPEPASRPTVLRLFYFVESDQEFDPAAVEAIERQAAELQSYWYEQFGGTFRLPAGGVEVVYGDRPADWYANTPDGDDERWFRLMNIRAELQAKLNIDEGSRSITFPSARIDGRVGANRYEGAWMDGDDITCISGLVETTPYTLDFPANCLATLAHELGHVYGLGHEGADDDCMQFGFYHYVNGTGLCDFSPENRLIVTSDPENITWLDAEPGDVG